MFLESQVPILQIPRPILRKSTEWFSLSLGERAGVRAGINHPAIAGHNKKRPMITHEAF
jgi:hypothetical protein